jgi:hypothetical protein
MAKKIFLIALVILGSSVCTYQSNSKATAAENSASGSAISNGHDSHRHKPPYRIITSRYVSRSSIKHVVGPGNGVRLRLLQNGIDNTEIENLSIEYDSGIEYRMANIYGIDYNSLPLYVKVTYRTWNAFHAVQFDVSYEFMIYYPGTWEVTLWN